MKSSHLRDLQILGGVVVFLLAGSALLLAYSLFVATGNKGPGNSESLDVTLAKGAAFAFVGAAVAMLNWVYQAGNRRLGAIDLFGCEISAICRVCLVVDFAQDSVKGYKMLESMIAANTAAPPPPQFTSVESYTPVYDKNLSDLQSLDVNVVTSVTEFYTYQKTMMDFLRSTAAEKSDQARLQYMAQMIYMQFLMYESARKAVKELIDFEPNQAESLVNILCSELTLFTFLLSLHAGDFKGNRLRLRVRGYAAAVQTELDQIELARGEGRQPWDKAIASLAELRTRYDKLWELPIQELGWRPPPGPRQTPVRREKWWAFRWTPKAP